MLNRKIAAREDRKISRRESIEAKTKAMSRRLQAEIDEERRAERADPTIKSWEQTWRDAQMLADFEAQQIEIETLNQIREDEAAQHAA